MKHYLDLLQQTIRENWDEPALSDYRGVTLSFGDLAREICRMHILFEEAGISVGDKIALCGRNSARWAVTYFAILAYKAFECGGPDTPFGCPSAYPRPPYMEGYGPNVAALASGCDGS